MNLGVWQVVAIGIICATLVLQIINYIKFRNDGSNSTRYILIIKEVFFLTHAILMGPAVGEFYCAGLACLFWIYFKGFLINE